jgi:glyoxylase-like metal-dependent hydrolase (beta-lactamase superfamily II)
MDMRRFLISCLVFWVVGAPLTAQEAQSPRAPRWDARGLGPLPRMGITSLDVSDDGKEIVVGTIAAFGDPNVIVLDDAGKIARHYRVGQQWIDRVAFLPGSKEIIAICTMPAGKAGDRVEAFRLKDDQVILEKTSQEGPWFFHYGDHSNHPTMKLARAKNATALLAGNQVVIYRTGKDPATIRLPVNDPDTCVSLAIDENGWAVVGTTAHESAAGNNLYLIDPDQKKPVWSRAVNKDVENAPALKKSQYGTPTLPDGMRKELPQRDEKVWAPLSVAIHSSGGKRLIAAVDYQGWQRWVRSSATMKDDNQGLRFMPTKPTITVYDEAGKDGKSVRLTQHHWRCRGLARQPILPADDLAFGLWDLNLKTGRVVIAEFGPADGIPVIPDGIGRPWRNGGAGLIYYHPDGKRYFDARTNGLLFCGAKDPNEKNPWQIDLNKSVPKSPKPWVANARATPIVPGVWQLPGGRVESDLGGQRVIEAPDGLILIEGHAGLSFEREWAAMEAVGLDPKKVKYVLATHEHGDHAPGAYLWRVVTGAKFVCSEEMAYTLQHHNPLNTGYGLHPPVPTDIVIKKDTELDLAGLKVRAVRIPGHTAGSMAWHFEKSGKSFVAFGDLIMPRGVLGYSGSVNFSARDALSSLRKLHDLKVDYVLPGHGAVEGPGNYFQAGIDVGTAVGWGFIKPERPDPRFRITQKNVLVVGWGQQATSAAFGDVNGDGKPDVVLVSPDGDGSVVKFFLNHNGKFKDEPDHEIKVPVSQPHKIRVMRSWILVAGKTAALLIAKGPLQNGKLPAFKIIPFDLADGNNLRFWSRRTLVSRRFGGFYELRLSDPPELRKFEPDINDPYVDLHLFDAGGLLTSYGKYYAPGPGARYPKTPTFELPREKDWTFLAVGDFKGLRNADRQFVEDAVLLSYGMDKSTTARVFYATGKADRPFPEKADAVISLTDLLKSAKKGNAPPLVRDTPMVADWNGDGIDDLIVAHGQSDEVLVLLGGKEGLNKDRVQRISLEYRVHYEHGVFVGDFNGDGKADLAVFGYTNTGVGAGGPPAVYIWLQ